METTTAQQPQGTANPTSGGLFQSGQAYIRSQGEKMDVSQFSADLTSLHLVSDLGGSEGRTMQLRRGVEPSEDDLIIVNSDYAVLDPGSDTSTITSVSNEIMDNLELFIREEEGSPYIRTSWFDEPKHILKGSLLDVSNEIRSTINNQHDKTNDIGIFVNHLTNVAIAAYNNQLTQVSLKTAFTLPVKERHSTKERLQLLYSHIAGIYTIEIPRLDYTLTVNIDSKDISVESEAATAFLYMLASSGGNPDVLNYANQTIVINDVGKTTYNMVLIDKGTVMSGKSATDKFGGDNLQASLFHYLQRTRPEAINFAQAGRALETGYLEIGSERIPISQELTVVKQDFAKKMVKSNIEFLQNSFLQSTQIYANVFLGRTMRHTGEMYENGEVSENFSPSIGQLFIDQFKKLSGTTEGFILATPGLATLLGLVIMMKDQWKL